MKMKKNCELCKGLARMHCESDQASLCWSCDFKVHSANFLVERHSRTLLCHVCQSPTPWTAAGSKLSPIISVCDSCVHNYDKINGEDESRAANDNEGNETEIESGNMDEGVEEEDDDDDDDEDEDEDEDDDEDIDKEDNQVVPWSPSTPPPHSAASSSSDSGEESYFSSSSSSSSQRHRREAQEKRTRENSSDLRLNINFGSTPPQEKRNAPPATVAVAAGCDGGKEEERVGWLDSLSATEERSSKRPRMKAVLSGPGYPGQDLGR